MTHAGVLGQVWRGGPRQARLSQALAGIDVRPLEEPMGKEAGRLLGLRPIQVRHTGAHDSVARATRWPKCTLKDISAVYDMVGDPS